MIKIKYVNQVSVTKPGGKLHLGRMDSIFLAGPTPRSYLRQYDGSAVASWRPNFIEALDKHGFNGYVFVPETADGGWLGDHESQIEWEYRHLEKATAIAFWVPRDLAVLPGFTTNFELGFWLRDPKSFYGRPPGAPKTKYLDYMYSKVTGRVPASSTDELIHNLLCWLGNGTQH